jgi:hypothetical protein
MSKKEKKISDAQTMIRYLLGELSDEEQSSVEEKYFTDTECFEQLRDLDNELVYLYVHDRLSQEDRQRLERHFLRTPERQEKLKLFKALTEYSAQQKFEKQPAIKVVKSLGSAWHSVRTTLADWLMPEPAQIEANIGLLPGFTMDLGKLEKIEIVQDKVVVNIKLFLEVKDKFENYRIRLQTEERRELLIHDNLQAQTTDSVTTILLQVPGSVFLTGSHRYIIILDGMTSSGEPQEVGDYHFRVVKK